jgi:hypothetical protein
MNTVNTPARGTSAGLTRSKLILEIGAQAQGPEVLDLLRVLDTLPFAADRAYAVARKAGGRTQRFRERAIDDAIRKLSGDEANQIALEGNSNAWQLLVAGATCDGIWAVLTLNPNYVGWCWTNNWTQPVAIRNKGDFRTFRAHESSALQYPDRKTPNYLQLAISISMATPVAAEDLVDWLWALLGPLDRRLIALRPFGGAFDSRTRRGAGWANQGYFPGDYPAIDAVYRQFSTKPLRLMSITIGRSDALRRAHRDLGPSTQFREIACDVAEDNLGMLRIPLDVLQPYREEPPDFDWFLRESVTPAGIDVARAVKKTDIAAGRW